MNPKSPNTYTPCPICGGVSVAYENGGGYETHNPLCPSVRALSERLDKLEKLLVERGLMPEPGS